MICVCTHGCVSVCVYLWSSMDLAEDKVDYYRFFLFQICRMLNHVNGNLL